MFLQFFMVDIYKAFCKTGKLHFISFLLYIHMMVSGIQILLASVALVCRRNIIKFASHFLGVYVCLIISPSLGSFTVQEPTQFITLIACIVSGGSRKPVALGMHVCADPQPRYEGNTSSPGEKNAFASRVNRPRDRVVPPGSWPRGYQSHEITRNFISSQFIPPRLEEQRANEFCEW